MKNLFLSLFLFLLIACNSNRNNDKEQVAITEQESTTNIISPYLERDSLNFQKAKEETLLDLQQRFEGKDLEYEYITAKGAANEITSVVRVRKFFDDTFYYAIIYTIDIEGATIDVYKLLSDSVEHKIKAGNYILSSEDTIFDVNGDGTKDFLVNYYPLSGCCRRKSYNIFLSPTSQKGLVTDYIQLINPTFYPEEHLIRGVEYGHPGEVPLYKGQWKGNKLEIMEYIYPDYTTKGKTFIRTHKVGAFPKRSEGTPLKVLPKEYKTVEDLDWFLLYGEGMFDLEVAQQRRGI